jgi:hypothetical protein
MWALGQPGQRPASIASFELRDPPLFSLNMILLSVTVLLYQSVLNTIRKYTFVEVAHMYIMLQHAYGVRIFTLAYFAVANSGKKIRFPVFIGALRKEGHLRSW